MTTSRPTFDHDRDPEHLIKRAQQARAQEPIEPAEKTQVRRFDHDRGSDVLDGAGDHWLVLPRSGFNFVFPWEAGLFFEL